MTETKTKTLRRTLIGDVVSDKMDKTVVVSVERRFPHPRYGRIVKRRTKVKAHDEKNACRLGDRVQVVESRPLSRDKRWRVLSILRKGAAAVAAGSGPEA
ncbi:MAG: 30S ribosomal protein S17 [Nitrospirae bacterium RBG_16_64_22]|nr:MAG: 30S ribosomal protein S17 [Nitrospirae bacterium RBG_16_64_22]